MGAEVGICAYSPAEFRILTPGSVSDLQEQSEVSKSGKGQECHTHSVDCPSFISCVSKALLVVVFSPWLYFPCRGSVSIPCFSPRK